MTAAPHWRLRAARALWWPDQVWHFYKIERAVFPEMSRWWAFKSAWKQTHLWIWRPA